VEDLKPCPWCGEDPQYMEHAASGEASLGCINSACKFEPMWAFKIELSPEFIAAWNKRADDVAYRELAKLCRKLLSTKTIPELDSIILDARILLNQFKERNTLWPD